MTQDQSEQISCNQSHAIPTHLAPNQKYGPYGPGRDEAFALESNVRELGGYQTADGRTVRHGLLWRTSAFGLLDKGELARLRELGIRFDLDLRSAAEARDLPDPQLSGVAYERICGMLDARGDEVDFSPDGMARILEAHREAKGLARTAAPAPAGSAPAASADPMLSPQSREVMDELYVGMAFNNAAYRSLFAHLEAGDVPIAFHCTAGKDRTGVAAMLVLLALGASEEDALFEYLLTNTYRAEQIRRAAVEALGCVSDEVPEEIAMRYGVGEEMGRGVLAAILQRYGSYEAYFAAEYGLDVTRLAALRERYTE